MTAETIHFYEMLNGFADFSEFHNSRWYQPLPEDWCVVVTDIRGSTRAIEQGDSALKKWFTPGRLNQGLTAST